MGGWNIGIIVTFLITGRWWQAKCQFLPPVCNGSGVLLFVWQIPVRAGDGGQELCHQLLPERKRGLNPEALLTVSGLQSKNAITTVYMFVRGGMWFVIEQFVFLDLPIFTTAGVSCPETYNSWWMFVFLTVSLQCFPKGSDLQLTLEFYFQVSVAVKLTERANYVNKTKNSAGRHYLWQAH